MQRFSGERTSWVIVLICCLGLCYFIGQSKHVAAQDATNTPSFRLNTNTPEPSATTFQTNTPEPSVTPSPTITLTPTRTPEPSSFIIATNTDIPIPTATNTVQPSETPIKFATATDTPIPSPTPLPRADAAQEEYALSFLFEDELVALFIEHINALSEESEESQWAVELIEYELLQRFPNAPTNPEDRSELLNAMLNAPIGTTNIRHFARPYFEQIVNEQDMDTTDFEIDGFRFMVMPAHFSNREGDADRLLHVIYIREDGLAVYDDYLFAISQDDGSYILPVLDNDIPSMPYDGVLSMEMTELDDLNRDTLDEVMLQIYDGGINTRIVILGYRNEVISDLTINQPILFSKILDWNHDPTISTPPKLRLIESRAESEQWRCYSTREIQWAYINNFYRIEEQITDFRREDSLSCQIFDLEAQYAALSTIEIIDELTLLIQRNANSPDAPQARFVLALYTSFTNPDEARGMLEALDTTQSNELQTQIDVVLSSLDQDGIIPVNACLTMIESSSQPLCDLNTFLMRALQSQSFSIEHDLVEQLIEVGLPVIEAMEVVEIGKRDRVGVRFDLPDTTLITFLAQSDGSFLIEATPNEDINRIALADTLRIMLLEADDIGAVVATSANYIRENPSEDLDPATRYMIALSYDLGSSSIQARNAYYELWTLFPDSVWGQLAGKHLELR